MKKLFIICGICSATAACTATIFPSEMNLGINACKTNEGLYRVVVNNDTTIQGVIQCNNGAEFKFDRQVP